MEIIRIPKVMQDTVGGLLIRGRTIGFVPTMGALHEGHLSLVRRSREENEKTVVSIFVNPLQFGPSEDFARYPRDIEGDVEKLEAERVDILFMPEASLMYPVGFSTRVEVGTISETMCGACRPGHFAGVATVVAKLFHIVKPTRAYFGQKDFQQAVVIRRMVKDLNMDVEIVVCPTVREKDGLAMSSRNMYLSGEQRPAAAVLFRSLKGTAESLASGIIQIGEVRHVLRQKILSEPAVSSVDYAGAYDPETLEELAEPKGEILLACAVWIGSTRLIDNILINIKKER